MDGGKPARERQALFEGNASQSAAYAKHRPSPPQALFDAIATYAGPGAPTEVALDVATGTGQATGGLATRYGRVIGLDVSKAQLAEASSGENAKPNVEFQEGTAESTGLPDSSVDLVTVAQALHWFDQPRAFAEFARVLKPGGVLAAWGYDLPSLAGERDASAMLLKLYEETLGPYWDDKRKLVERRYKDIHIPPPFEELQRWDSTMTVETTVGGVMGMIASWSGYNSYREAHPNKPDPLMMFHGELKEELEFPGHDTVVDLEYPVFMLLARKPR
mmetsp:Transcript_2368/g.7147  ORF Transcript_2368/g.7147 Transcript_2368/m.7147 type:complete len:275 (+) Transcript_2368:224-1048(+)|eukprot:CAMPEP_0206150780 /NCGR_PEP_ID=MMETSP1473-20131121/38477_1 /ASSEMBLY_ACC=CAM_ASM_001109 /TAXON_ID=1461547 /ORGANISM="Stichococcus sp, Strain RCC1054" /LENGTH=274 /DNA_ID=CAMNT_0053548301 /DNA_START=715 /DNA_END=1539 /DNA_ORIENTATION=-